MKLKSLFLGLALTAFVPSFVLADTTVMKLGTGDPENSEQGIAAKAFAEYVNKNSDNEIKVETFFGGALGDESESLKNVQRGSLPFTVAGIANLVPFNKKLGVLTLPYLFVNLDEVVQGTTGESAELLNDYAVESGFRVLSWTYTDFRYISNSKKQIKTIEDMKGLKFRVPQSAVLISSYKAFGGSPTPISWSETFTALQQNVVDGQCYGFIGFDVMKFAEANQKYISEVHYTYQLQPLVMSERVYKKLSPEQQELMVAAGEYAQDKVLEYQKAEGSKAKAKLISEGIVITPIEDEEKWQEAAFEKVWPEMSDFVGGEDAINAYLDTMGKPKWTK